MDAGEGLPGAVRALLLEALRADPALARLVNAVHEGESPEPAPPHVSLARWRVADAGAKGLEGARFEAVISIKDDARSGERAARIADAVREVVAKLDAGEADYKIGVARVWRGAVRREKSGRWAVTIDAGIGVFRRVPGS